MLKNCSYIITFLCIIYFTIHISSSSEIISRIELETPISYFENKQEQYKLEKLTPEAEGELKFILNQYDLFKKREICPIPLLPDLAKFRLTIKGKTYYLRMASSMRHDELSPNDMVRPDINAFYFYEINANENSVDNGKYSFSDPELYTDIEQFIEKHAKRVYQPFSLSEVMDHFITSTFITSPDLLGESRDKWNQWIKACDELSSNNEIDPQETKYLKYFFDLPPVKHSQARYQGIQLILSGHPKQAIQALEPLAQQGDCIAQYYLGILLQRGSWTKEEEDEYEMNPVQGIHWIEQSAQAGYVKAQAWMGDYYLKNMDNSDNEEKSLYWYRHAAQGGDVDSQYILGVWWSYVLNKKDPRMGIHWFEKAAHQGDDEAQRELGYLYATTQENWKNPELGKKWMECSAKQGNAQAQQLLAIFYFRGIGTVRDEIQAFSWWSQAASRGNSNAQLLTALCYALGRGTSRDENKAVQIFNKYLKSDYCFDKALVFYCLGMLYYSGHDLGGNAEEAAKWFKAARKGDYLLHDALQILTQRARQGDATAQKILTRLNSQKRNCREHEREIIH